MACSPHLNKTNAMEEFLLWTLKNILSCHRRGLRVRLGRSARTKAKSWDVACRANQRRWLWRSAGRACLTEIEAVQRAVVAERYNRDRKRERRGGKAKSMLGFVLLAAAYASCAIRGQTVQYLSRMASEKLGCSEISYSETRIFLEESRPTAEEGNTTPTTDTTTTRPNTNTNTHTHTLCNYCAALPSLVVFLFPVNRCCRLTVVNPTLQHPHGKRRRISSERG